MLHKLNKKLLVYNSNRQPDYFYKFSSKGTSRGVDQYRCCGCPSLGRNYISLFEMRELLEKKILKKIVIPNVNQFLEP